jgi:hypothetical protein
MKTRPKYRPDDYLTAYCENLSFVMGKVSEDIQGTQYNFKERTPA